MDELTGIRAFLHVVDDGSFAAAARSLGLTRSVINKRVNALEAELGVALLTRSTRHVAPTDAGLEFYERARAVVSQLDDAMSLASQTASRPTGTLRVNAPMSYGQRCVAPVVARFMAAHPDVRVELALSDRQVDPLEEGFDLTIRVGKPEAMTSLKAIELGAMPRRVVAAPSYLANAGTPERPSELKKHKCLHYGYQQSGSAWPLTTAGGEQSVAINCALWSNNGDVLAEAATLGAGLALLPDFLTESARASGALVEVLSEHAPTALVVSALYARHRHLSGAVRAFLDELPVAESSPAGV